MAVYSNVSEHNVVNTREVPLNPSQEGILFDNLKHSDGVSNYYVSQLVIYLSADIHVLTFFQAWEDTLQNNKSCFSLAVTKNSSTFPILENLKLPMHFTDLSDLTPGQRKLKLDAQIKADQKDAFDLAHPPLLRVSLYKLAEQEYCLVWAKHHILMDGEGSYCTLREVFTRYTNYIHQRSLPIERYVVPMHITSTDIQQDRGAEAFWKSQLLGVVPESGKFTPFKQSALQGRGETKAINFSIGQSMLDKIDAYTAANSITFNAVIQGVLAIVMSFYSEHNKICLGTVRRYNNRSKYGIGLYTNTIPIVMDVDPQQKFTHFFQYITETNGLLRKYAHTPLEYIREWSELPADQPLFDTVIDYKPVSLDERLSSIFPEIGFSSEFNLAIPYSSVCEVRRSDSALNISFKYDSHLYDEDYMQEICETYQRVLQDIVENGKERLANVCPLSAENYQRIVSEFNNTDKAYSAGLIPDMIEAHARVQPDATALIDNARLVSYAELNQLSNQFARFLFDRGCRPKMKIAVCLRAGIDQSVVLLAVLKLGCAVVPIDCHYPMVRVQQIVTDVNAAMYITVTDFRSLFDSEELRSSERPVICIDQDVLAWRAQDNTNLDISVPPEADAYVIYTSGSSGRPKGVVVQHQQWVEMMHSSIDRLGVDASTRIMQLSAFGFDVYLCEWGMAMVSGGALCLFDNHPYSAGALVSKMLEYEATLIICASSILASLPRCDMPHLKTIAIGGERCPQDAVDYWSQRSDFHIVYGITETAICSSMHRVDASAPSQKIGTPLNNVKMYILDEYLQPCPVNIPGEIFVSGKGVAPGYLNSPEVTARCFIKDPFCDDGSMMYRSGDVGRYNRHGEMEFLHRKDSQCKVRGFRVEINEVQKRLDSIPGVSSSFVRVVKVEETNYLLAYVVTAASYHKPDINHFLRQKLPSHMIPHDVLFVKEFSMTPNGKIDVTVLPNPFDHDSYSNPENQSDHMSDVKNFVSNSAKHILKHSDIQDDKNFFDLGFDSLSISRFSSYLESEHNVKVSVSELFSYTTINALSDYIERNKLNAKV